MIARINLGRSNTQQTEKILQPASNWNMQCLNMQIAQVDSKEVQATKTFSVAVLGEPPEWITDPLSEWSGACDQF